MDMAEAKLNWEYALRVVGVGALMVGICVWSLYDGVKAWPRCNREMEEVRPVLLATNLTAEAWLMREDDDRSRVQTVFAAQGMKVPSKLVRKLGELRVPDSAPDRDAARAAQLEQVRKLFEKPVYSAHDLQTQFIQAVVTLLLGLCALGAVGLKARKRFCADANGLSGSGVGARPVAYDAIQAVDWSKWDEKGIVKITFKDGGRLTLDGWHFSGITGVVDEIAGHRPDLASGR
jgi:hypothetical protein